MNRYFFPTSRSHHAYSMAKDFGIEFEKRSGVWSHEGLMHLTGATSYKIYVHPDSLHLLKPQVGDLVRLRWLDGSVSHRPWSEEDAHQDAALDRDVRVPAQIIQRNGIAFHWPECETASA